MVISHHGGFFGLTGIMVSGVRILYILRKVKGVSLFHYVVIDSTKHKREVPAEPV